MSEVHPARKLGLMVSTFLIGLKSIDANFVHPFIKSALMILICDRPERLTDLKLKHPIAKSESTVVTVKPVRSSDGSPE